MCSKKDEKIERSGNIYLTKVSKNKHDQSIQNNKQCWENVDREPFTPSHR